ncbi:RibD family protein [Micromonospora ureilytica]|uniref:5-amino-6-(5-phosphoribosylamino)uracil reductase n=1 Tax=Micromonospora ureilytica TaxID=709868 RepID=A0ABS0JFW8_9ACTN|nr:dihydrofolate reductase family protein [Micromonospora ureilytica]MBG6065381.1 5-amino-6-(5-phosphoribosylamino)uracil reductase [Micromonospora ureilytica]WSR54983.1 dihydrofolate reductase family protein [Micromonospora ureilytica]
MSRRPEPTRPYVLLSCATSIDGYIDDASEQRLLLSNDEDLDRVDEVRASCDAILVGAGTVRRDDPRLLVRSPNRRAERVAAGRPASPTKVTLTARGDLDPTARFFTAGDAARLVYCATGALEKTQERVGRLATVIDAGEPVDPEWLLTDLAARGVQRLMVEGGGTVHAQFLAAGLADELHLVVAPFFVGDGRAPRFVGEGRFPWHPGRRARLAEARQIGDVVLLRYALSTRCPADPPAADPARPIG